MLSPEWRAQVRSVCTRVTQEQGPTKVTADSLIAEVLQNVTNESALNSANRKRLEHSVYVALRNAQDKPT